MLATKVVCPFCSKRLKTTKPLGQGHRILCPQCQRSFPLVAETVAVGAAQTSPALGLPLEFPPPAPAAVELPPAPPSVPPRAAVEGPADPPTPSTVPPPLPPMTEACVPAPHGARSLRGPLLVAAACAVLLLGAGGVVALCVYLAERKDDRQARVAPQEASVPSPAPEAAPQAKPDAKPEAKPTVSIPPADPLPAVRPRPADTPEPPVPPLLSPPPPRKDPPPPRKEPPPPEPPLPPPPQPAPAMQQALLPPEEQEKVNKAIDRGVAYLKKTQRDTGSWAIGGQAHQVGRAALPGLALLECGVAPTDPRVQRIARVVRSAGPTMQQTYELALSILFLDRLGEPEDRVLIQKLAMRLVAGQSDTGGWTYVCPILDPAIERNLVTVLRDRQRPPLEGELAGNGRKGPAGVAAGPGRGDLGKTTQTSKPPTLPTPGTSGSTVPLPAPPEARPQPGREARADAAAVKKALEALPPAVRRIPALNDVWLAPARTPRMDSDNSNTQFGLLGVWVASRHGVPTEKTLAHLARRFRVSQNPDGGWSYVFSMPGSTPSMTGAGLLGLAVGLGLAVPENAEREMKEKPPKDAGVEKGLHALAENIGQPLGVKGPARIRDRGPRMPMQRTDVNLYFLWTLERVGVLYNLRHIDGKDWYRWGSELLVDAQQPDGSWTSGGYPGSQPDVDTCFALLFLKRANFVQDLSRRLEFVIDVRSLNTGPALPKPSSSSGERSRE
jgi:hypothetical protein